MSFNIQLLETVFTFYDIMRYLFLPDIQLKTVCSYIHINGIMMLHCCIYHITGPIPIPSVLSIFSLSPATSENCEIFSKSIGI